MSLNVPALPAIGATVSVPLAHVGLQQFAEGRQMLASIDVKPQTSTPCAQQVSGLFLLHAALC